MKLLSKLVGISITIGTALAALTPSSYGAELKSVYTKFNFDDCEVLTRNEESESISSKCPGYKGFSVYASADDLRVDIDYGLPNFKWESFSPFNHPHSVIEWLVDGDTPVATIHRFFLGGSNDPADKKMEVLKISKVARHDQPGCPIAFVNASANANSNILAREAAQAASTFNCKTDKIKIVGARGNPYQTEILNMHE